MSGRTQVSLTPEALRHLELRRLVEESIERCRGALVGCGAVSEAEMSLLLNLALSWQVGVYFSDSRSEVLSGPLAEGFASFRQRGYRGEVLPLGALAATLPIEPYPARIAFLHLVGEEIGPLVDCAERLAPLLTDHGIVALAGLAHDETARSTLGRCVAEHGLVPFQPAEAPSSTSLACWTRPGAYRDPEGTAEAAATPAPAGAFVVLTYPDRPAGKFARMCRLAGYATTCDPTAEFDLAIKWLGETYTPRDPVLAELSNVTHVYNLDCEDISKTRVEELHREVFGYGLLVDPLTHRGLCVRKANLNAQCRESVVECPIAGPAADDFVYQRLIRTPREPDEFEEYRVPITGPEIPCVVIKRRPVSRRFDRSAGYAAMTPTGEVFTAAERASILALCRRMGLEFGDVDILRDRDDGRLHVLDVNPTPGGPGGGYTESQRRDLIATQLAALRRNFGTA